MLEPKLFSLVILAAGLSGTANAITIDSTYTFTGTCTADCTGTATGTLVLSNYTLGDDLSSSNFVSFSYSSNYLSYSLPQSGLEDILGSIDGPLPSFEYVFLFGYTDVTFPGNGTIASPVSFLEYGNTGDWCVGADGVSEFCTIADSSDVGVNGIFSGAGVPEPATYATILLAGAGLLIVRRKR
jgi:hypothetical protein